MKYGPIICDPNSEEAKKLIGKKVVASHEYVYLDKFPEFCNPYELSRIDEEEYPFIANWTRWTFIREVIEEKPKYRPYEDTNEMVEDFKNRFCKHTTIPQYSMPLIWVTFPNGPKEIVSAFGKNTVWLNGDCFMLDYIFETGYTYLDGSPVGKEVK